MNKRRFAIGQSVWHDDNGVRVAMVLYDNDKEYPTWESDLMTDEEHDE